MTFAPNWGRRMASYRNAEPPAEFLYFDWLVGRPALTPLTSVTLEHHSTLYGKRLDLRPLFALQILSKGLS